MESTVSYILIAVIMILSFTVYNYRKKQIRYYQLSIQKYPELAISILIQKTQRKISAVIFSLSTIEDMDFSDIKVELISRKREFNYYSLKPIISMSSLPTKLEKNKKIEFPIPFEEFRTLLMDGELPFRTFRFIAVSDKGKSYKSHEMGFDKKWVIYRPDSGKYN